MDVRLTILCFLGSWICFGRIVLVLSAYIISSAMLSVNENVEAVVAKIC